MSQLKYPITIVTVSAAVFVVYGFVVGMFTILNIPPNPCEMTYMFEHPKYIPGRNVTGLFIMVHFLLSCSFKFWSFISRMKAYNAMLAAG